MLTEKRCLIPIHVEDFCKTSLIELFTKTPEYILGHDVECGFSIYRKSKKHYSSLLKTHYDDKLKKS